MGGCRAGGDVSRRGEGGSGHHDPLCRHAEGPCRPARREGCEQAPPQAGQSEGQQGGGLADAAGEISKIEADGHVQIITPNESARGDVGVYDVNKGMITLTGAVKLTQGRSQLEGERLVLDLNKGRSTLESGRKGPVRGLFVPEKK